jgi:hypothetical protein
MRNEDRLHTPRADPGEPSPLEDIDRENPDHVVEPKEWIIEVTPEVEYLE